MRDLVLPNFPDSILERVDAYIKLLEKLNPGRTWSRASAISTLSGARVGRSRRLRAEMEP